MRFWDSSAVVSLIVKEPLSDQAKRLTDADPDIVAWWGTRVECTSALRRRERDGSTTADGPRAALGRLESLAGRWWEVLPSNAVRVVAGRSLGVHELGASDALQLAAALNWRGDALSRHEFVCFDNRLADAAEREGFAVLRGT